MTYRENRKDWIIYPESKFKSAWDLFMTIVLLTTCILTPLDIAFSMEVNSDIFDNPVSLAIDIFFFFDILIIFNTAFYTVDMDLIDIRKDIAKIYLKGWFSIDLIAIIPFDTILNASNFNALSRVARIGRLYKLVKLTRLLRILKILKDKNKFLKYLTDFLKLGLGFERLLFFILIFLLGMHLSACFWLITASFMGQVNNIYQDGVDPANPKGVEPLETLYTFNGTWLGDVDS
jgi:hypothetical protein